MSWLAQLATVLAIFLSGAGIGVKYQLGVQAQIDIAASEARAADSLRQVRAIDKASTAHVTELSALNKKLGDARGKIALLSGRECFDVDTVRVLNNIGDQPVRTASSDAEGAPPALATGSGLRYSTDRDAAGAIAICRASYSEVSSQLNQILDIEDQRDKYRSENNLK